MGVSPRGTTLSYGTPGVGNALPSSWTEVASVVSINPPGKMTPAVMNYGLSDTFKKKRAGRLADSDDVTMTLEFDPSLAGHDTLRELQDAPDTNNKYWKVAFEGDGLVTSAQVTWQGPLTGFTPGEIGNEEDENITAEVTIAVGSDPVWTVGSNS